MSWFDVTVGEGAAELVIQVWGQATVPVSPPAGAAERREAIAESAAPEMVS